MPAGQRMESNWCSPKTAIYSCPAETAARRTRFTHGLLADWPYSSTACCGSWTANGRYYIFQASEALPNTTVILSSLWALPESKNGESAAPTKITNGPMSFGNASLARDNKKIWAIGVQPTVEVVKFEARQKKFVPLIPGLSATDVDFSADGKWIA